MGSEKLLRRRQWEIKTLFDIKSLKRNLGLTLCGVMASLLLTSTLVAQENSTAADELIEMLQQTNALQGRFEQNQYDATGALLAHSSGHFRMLRPGYFSWEIESPDKQLILASPEYIWHHDKDLETVTRRPVGSSSAMSPLQILGGNEQLLRSSYSVSKSSGGTFTLIPKQAEPGLTQLTLKLDDSHIVAMEIMDALNQRVEIQFLDVDNAAALTTEDFMFSPPQGADLFYYDQ